MSWVIMMDSLGCLHFPWWQPELTCGVRLLVVVWQDLHVAWRNFEEILQHFLYKNKISSLYAMVGYLSV